MDTFILRDVVFCRIDPGSKKVSVKPLCSLERVWVRDCACDDESEDTRLDRREIRLMAGQCALQYLIE